jgi:hypothetical protein
VDLQLTANWRTSNPLPKHRKGPVAVGSDEPVAENQACQVKIGTVKRRAAPRSRVTESFAGRIESVEVCDHIAAARRITVGRRPHHGFSPDISTRACSVLNAAAEPGPAGRWSEGPAEPRRRQQGAGQVTPTLFRRGNPGRTAGVFVFRRRAKTLPCAPGSHQRCGVEIFVWLETHAATR